MMDESKDRLYSGALSQAAKKVLAVLYAQSSQRYPRQRQSVRICESQTWLQSSMNMTQEEREGRDTQRETRPWLQPQVSLSSPHDHLLSQTSSCCQHMETSETCSSEQASSSSSSSCWGSSLHRHRLQNPAFGHRPQVYSHTQLSTGPIHQSSPSPIFMQDEVSKRVRDSSHRDDFTLTLQTPARFFKHQFEDTEDTRPSFVNSVSTDDKSPDVVLVPTVEHSSVLHTEPASECQQVSFCCRTSVGSTANSQGTVTEMKENTAAADCYPQCKPPAEESRLERRGHVHRDTDLMVKAVKIHQDGNEDEKELKKQMELKQTNKMRRSLVLWTSEDRDKDLSPGCIPEGHEDKEKPVSDYNSSMKHISVSSERETSEVLSQSLDERAEEPHSVRTVELTRDEQVTAEVKADFEIRIKDKWTTVSLTNTTDEKESDLSRAQQRHGQGQMSGEEIKETSIKDSESMIPHMDRGAENTFTGDAGKSLTQGLSPECLHQNSDNIQNKSLTKTFLTAQDSKERKLSLFSPHQTPLHSCPLIHSSSLKRTHSDPQLQDHDAPPNTNPSRCGSKWKQKRVGERRSFEAAEDTESPSKAGSLKYLTSDPRVKDSGKLNTEEKQQMLKRVSQSETVLLTLVFQDGRTQLEPEQKVTAPVCGLMMLIIWKVLTPSERSTDPLGPNDSLVYLKLHKQKPAWVQHSSHLSPELFTRDVLLQVLSRPGLVVCYKAKDFLRTVLQFYEDELTWKQVAGCHIQDPQVSGWLLDPADPSSCFHDLLNKHCKKYTPSSTPGARPGSRFISALCSLYWLNLELRSKLQSHGLWELYSHMELNMIPVLAAMESQHIHVDKAALRGTSDLLGSKMKQLEQEAHRAAGQTFLITSNTQLRTVLFEKLRLDLLCENKKLPKTINKQQSTSEAVLLQLQDLHPLPKIILEYRQIHKIKSTFVDGILSCMERKNHISSTWYQTSVVTGRISAKHPNFQALPRQPLHITKKQHIHGKVEEVVTVHPRAMFIPQKGWTFLAADFCQVELRLLAHLSSDPELLRIFTEPQADVFTLLASQWKGLSECDVTPEDREQAKRMVYSVVYGAGRERLSGILGVSSDQARQFQDRFLQTYREVQAFIQKTIQICHKQGYVLSIMGRRRSLPHIRSPDWATRMQAERQAVNFTVQGSAADLCKMAMIRIFDLVSSSSSLTARLTAQLHDELLYEVEDSQVEEFAALVKNTMESLQHIHHLGVHLKVPLKVAVSCGKSWGSMSELNFPSTSPSPPL